MNPTLDVARLRNVVNANPRYKAIFEMYLERQRGRQDSTPSRMRRVLRETGKGDYPLAELTKFYQDMQEAGAGRWVSGRNGQEGRFVWGFHLVSVAEAVLNRKAPVTAESEQREQEKINAITRPGGLRPAPEPRSRLPKIVMSEPEQVTAKPRKSTAKAKAGSKETPGMAQNLSALAGQYGVKNPTRFEAKASAPISTPTKAATVKIRFGQGPDDYIEAPLNMSDDERAEIASLVQLLRQKTAR